MTLAVSIVVPVYNVERYLEKCLNSIQWQSFSDFEVIVVNDGSTDSSHEIAEKFQQKDSRFKLIDQPNKGLGGARNTGILNSVGEFLFFLDSDDYIRPNTLTDLLDHQKINDVDIVVFGYDKVDENDALIDSPVLQSKISNRDTAFGEILSLKTSPQVCTKLFRSDLFVDNNILFPEHYLHEDVAVTYQLFWNADQVAYTNESFYCWVERSGSITQNFSYDHINDMLTSLTNTQAFLVKRGVYSKYEAQFAQGCVRLLNLLLRRSMQYKKYGCMDYLLFNIENRFTFDDNVMEQIALDDQALLSHYEKNCHRARSSIQQGFRRFERIETRRRKLGVLARKLFPFWAAGKIRIYELSYRLFPLNSRRREALKKIIGR